MESRFPLWVGIIIGSTLGGFIPELWGAGIFSVSSIALSAAGALAGLMVAFRLTR